jgi:hypothetical protein
MPSRWAQCLRVDELWWYGRCGQNSRPRVITADASLEEVHTLAGFTAWSITTSLELKWLPESSMVP